MKKLKIKDKTMQEFQDEMKVAEELWVVEQAIEELEQEVFTYWEDLSKEEQAWEKLSNGKAWQLEKAEDFVGNNQQWIEVE